MCVDTIKSFEERCKGTTPGFKPRVWVELERLVGEIPYPELTTEDHTVTADIPMLTPTEGRAGIWSEFPISRVPGKNTANSPEEGDADSSMYNHSFSFFIPGATGKKSHILKGLKNQSCILIHEDKENQRQIIGKNDDGCDFKVEEVNVDGQRGYNCTVTWIDSELKWFYTGAIAT